MIGKMISIVAAVSLAAGCSMATSGARARAELKDKDGRTVGSGLLSQRPDGVLVRVDVKGLTPGLHAVHVHAVGKCDAPAFTSAGGHFNPTGKKHGLKNPEGAHAGDLPNMLIGKDGAGRFETMTASFTLRPGPLTLLDADGSALVIHAAADDDVTDPTGNSGDRVACGLITAD